MWRRYVPRVFLGAMALGVAATTIAPDLALVTYLVPLAGALYAGSLTAGRRLRPMAPGLRYAEDEPWAFLIAGLIALITADLVRLSLGSGSSAVAQTVNMAAYPFSLIGIIALFAIRAKHRLVDALLESAIIAVALGVSAWTFLIDPFAVGATDTAARLLIGADLILGAFTAVMATQLIRIFEQPPKAFRYLVLALWAILEVHIVGSVGVILDRTMPAALLRPAALVAFGMWAYAALDPSSALPIEPVSAGQVRLDAVRVTLIGFAVLLGPVALGIDTAFDIGTTTLIVALGSGFLSLAAVAYLVRLVQERSGMEHRAHHDDLTGLPNRVSFRERTTVMIEGSRRTGQTFALMFLDLDHFKEVNDTHGHAAGNQLLQSVAERLRRCVRETDTVARLSGDEFALLYELKSTDDWRLLARRILRNFAKPFSIDSGDLTIGTSIGVALFPGSGGTYDILLKHADSAMYHAKQSGRNRYCLYRPRLQEDGSKPSRRGLEQSLARAIEENQFVLHYLPKVELKTRHLVGIEALVRWDHPTKGLVLPGRFLSTARESGQMALIEQWVLHTAFAQHALWLARGLQPITMTVNLTPRFDGTGVEDDVARALRASGLDPQFAEIDISETDVISWGAGINGTLAELKGLGVKCALDDFGTAEVSVRTLAGLPFDRLKIDRSLIRTAGDVDSSTRALVSAAIGLGHGLGFSVVGVGVEGQDELAFLRRLGCDEVQGYLFSKPLTARQFQALLNDPEIQRRHRIVVPSHVGGSEEVVNVKARAARRLSTTG